jgi:hypothetical protein
MPAEARNQFRVNKKSLNGLDAYPNHMPSRKDWRNGFIVGLFLFGPGLEKYLRDRATNSGNHGWADFYNGLANIVRDAGTDPDKALKLADSLYTTIWGEKQKSAPHHRATRQIKVR